MFEYGFERDRVGPAGRDHLVVRWWIFLYTPGLNLRNQRARLGVVDRGFHFARGGRTATEEEARRLLSEAHTDATREAEYWRGQPSHMLGPAGQLVPLDEVVPELTA